MTSTLEQRVNALPATCKATILGYLEFLEWKNKHSVGAYASQDDADDKRSKRRALGARLLAIRTTLRQSIEEAADVAGINPDTYERYERGIIGRWPTPKVISYAETWKVSLDWLLDGDGAMFRDGGPPQLEPSDAPMVETAAPRGRGPRGPYGCRTNVAPASNVVHFAPRVQS